MKHIKALQTQRSSLHLNWDDLSYLGATRLSAVIGRDIDAICEHEYDEWGFKIVDTPLTEAEITLLFDTVGASGLDRDINDFGDYPVVELSKGLSEKVIITFLPFLLSDSLANDNGVWFFGPEQTVPFDLSLENAEVKEDKVGVTRCSECATRIICDDSGDMPTECPGCTRKLNYSAYKAHPGSVNDCKCGGTFSAHQICHHDVVTD